MKATHPFYTCEPLSHDLDSGRMSELRLFSGSHAMNIESLFFVHICKPFHVQILKPRLAQNHLANHFFFVRKFLKKKEIDELVTKPYWLFNNIPTSEVKLQ